MSDKPFSLAAAIVVEEIVRALSERKAPIDTEFGHCHLCDVQFVHYDEDAYENPEWHDEKCPWGRARKWMTV